MAPTVYIPNYGFKPPGPLRQTFTAGRLGPHACSYPIEYEGVWLDLVYIGFALLYEP